MSRAVEAETRRVREHMTDYRTKRLKRLKELDFFILDNSIRESTVGQLRSHTLQNKIDIFEQVKKCGLTHIIVASFAHMTRVDDDFCQHLKDSGEDFANLYSFSEVTEGLKDGRYDTKTIPVSCVKNKRYGLRNTIFETDLFNRDCDWGGKWKVRDHVAMLVRLFEWVRTEICADARILVNFRDFSPTMSNSTKRLLEVVHAIASLPRSERIAGIMYEDLGESMPEELGIWTQSVRRIMDAAGWRDGRLLTHVHEQWDLQTSSTLQCLEQGADGVWASLCEEGAAIGHAASSVTALNLVRLGNATIMQNYKCVEMRNAAREITRITTGDDPSPRQVIYGERALDMVFGFPANFVRTFDLNKFFGIEPLPRMNTMASCEMIRDRLVNLFGDDPQFTVETGQAMKEKMLEDLRTGRKEEYMSTVGAALLFDRSGGKLTATMRDVIVASEADSSHHQSLVTEVRQLWDTWDLQDEVAGDERLQYDSFYHGFMAPYFGCYRCSMTKDALKALDMDADGYVDWAEFQVYLYWALRQYPQLQTADDLLDTAFQKGIIPAMRDEQTRPQYKCSDV